MPLESIFRFRLAYFCTFPIHSTFPQLSQVAPPLVVVRFPFGGQLIAFPLHERERLPLLMKKTTSQDGY